VKANRLMTRRNRIAMSKPWNLGIDGISAKETCLLFARHSAYRRHDPVIGVDMEHGKLFNNVKGKDKCEKHEDEYQSVE